MNYRKLGRMNEPQCCVPRDLSFHSDLYLTYFTGMAIVFSVLKFSGCKMGVIALIWYSQMKNIIIKHSNWLYSLLWRLRFSRNGSGEVEGRAPKHPRSTENSITFIKLLTDFWSMVVDIHKTPVSVWPQGKGRGLASRGWTEAHVYFPRDYQGGNKEKKKVEWRESKEKEERIILWLEP